MKVSLKLPKKFSFIIPLLLFLFTYFGISAYYNGEVQGSYSSNVYHVNRVIDGDTIVVVNDKNSEMTIRMLGINTPETVDPRKPVECFGQEASRKLKGLLEGKDVLLEQDPQTQNIDKYGRLLRYVSLTNGTDINKIMIKEGYAYENGYGSAYTRQKEYKAAQAHAVSENLGLWNENTCSGKP